MGISKGTNLLLLLAIIQSTWANALRRWNDQPFQPDFLEVSRRCSSNACLSLFPAKRDGGLEEINDQPNPLTKVLPSYHVTGRPWQMSCPCETEYDIIDLGLENYPRYLATARCAAKACSNKFNPCRLIHYKVHILRQRETSIENDETEGPQYVEEIALPESLRMKWQMKPMKIAVACVANDSIKN